MRTQSQKMAPPNKPVVFDLRLLKKIIISVVAISVVWTAKDIWAGPKFHNLPIPLSSIVYRNFPSQPKHVWQETDALVPSKHQRAKLPWQLSVHDSVRNAFGHMALLRSDTKLCKVPPLQIQVDNPYRSENNLGKIKRSYVCLRFDRQCRGQEMEELWDRRYMKKYGTYQATFLMTDTTALNRLKLNDMEQFEQVMYHREGEIYVSALEGGDAISGNKAKQLQVKRSYAEKFGCDYNTLRIQPIQYTMHHPKECRSFFRFARVAPPKTMWIMKPVLSKRFIAISPTAKNKH
jgi:hypothetical protein